jgi:hypothetical protein
LHCNIRRRARHARARPLRLGSKDDPNEVSMVPPKAAPDFVREWT